MEKWHLIIDVEKCEDCNNCLLACKDEHVDNEWPGYSSPQPRHGHRWMDVLRKERGQYPQIDVAYRPTTCMHCGEAPCLAASDGSIYRRSDGIVLIDPATAQGRRELVGACPYGMIWWNEEAALPQKCTLCAHLLDQGWKEPRCVQSCPTGALRLEKLTDERMAARVIGEGLQVLQPELGTKPLVYYRNLYRFHTCFIAGSLAYETGGGSDCAKGARVTLARAGVVVNETECDAFGDFKFDALPPASGSYEIRGRLEGFSEESLEVALGEECISLGVILLSPLG